MINELSQKYENLYYQLNTIKSKNSESDYKNKIYEIYDFIYSDAISNEDFELSKDFKPLDDFAIKKLIVEHLNYENHLIETTNHEYPQRINDKINKALETLKKYNTPEYYSLLQNGFYNPFEERKPYENFTSKNYEMQTKEDFINNLKKLNIPEYRTIRIYKNLMSLLNEINSNQ